MTKAAGTNTHITPVVRAGCCASLLLMIGTGCTSLRMPDHQHATPIGPSDRFQALPETGLLSGTDATGPDDTCVQHPLERDHAVTLAECIRVALERNPRTRETWYAARAAAARVGEERAAYLLSVDLQSEVSRGRTVSLESGQENASRSVYAAGIDVSYLLFDGGARRARVAGAEAVLAELGFRHNTNLQDVALAVEVSYYELMGATWMVRVAEEASKRTQYQLELARARHEAGVVTRADVLRAETQRADAHLQVVQTRNGVRTSHGRLAYAMGIPVHSAFEIAELPDEVQREELPRTEQLVDEAARERPELRAALSRVEASRADVAAGQAAYWPTLGANVSAGHEDTEFWPERDEWSVGLAVTFPLFDGFERKHRVARARADLGRAMADCADLLQGIELEVWTAYWELTEAAEAMVAAGTLTASARESARLAEGEYKNGIVSIVGLIDAQTAQTEADRRLIQARLDWYTAKARFEWSVGRSFASGNEPMEATHE
ncbi:MAG: TolC family protein [Lentisphaerae bacterium]|jgi:outer membrane protein|nr:TolC family protein [Lentisphaerota bacterium]MBT5611194.1 TolC family protein [Lentisphaerota bacterium]MBT7054682.1 TolC family protein [Lentisphaerota bacterium]MBT7841940.1 TolC family protein [Lentisphaerota bacterium]